jgi:hypothetical protein
VLGAEALDLLLELRLTEGDELLLDDEALLEALADVVVRVRTDLETAAPFEDERELEVTPVSLVVEERLVLVPSFIEELRLESFLSVMELLLLLLLLLSLPEMELLLPVLESVAEPERVCELLRFVVYLPLEREAPAVRPY